MNSSPQPRRHLMDPHAPRVATRPADGAMSITTVQRWVLTVLLVTTVEHFALGFVFGARSLDDQRLGAQWTLLIMAGLVGLAGMVGALALHGRQPASWWLLLGLLPAAFGVWWVF